MGDLPASRKRTPHPLGQSEGRRKRREESEGGIVLGARESRVQGEGRLRLQRNSRADLPHTDGETERTTGTHRLNERARSRGAGCGRPARPVLRGEVAQVQRGQNRAPTRNGATAQRSEDPVTTRATARGHLLPTHHALRKGAWQPGRSSRVVYRRGRTPEGLALGTAHAHVFYITDGGSSQTRLWTTNYTQISCAAATQEPELHVRSALRLAPPNRTLPRPPGFSALPAPRGPRGEPPRYPAWSTYRCAATGPAARRMIISHANATSTLSMASTTSKACSTFDLRTTTKPTKPPSATIR